MDYGGVIGAALLVVMPTIHMGIYKYIWVPDKEKVDRANCKCGCWDTVFKGSYENPPAGYHHLYFNATRNVFWIWLLTVIAVITFYELIKHFFRLWQQSSLRSAYLFLFVSVFYSHYYSWWVYVGYLNDDFYTQWYHQLFFTTTEMASTALVIHLCNLQNKFTAPKIFYIVLIACIHLSIGGLDQFVEQILLLSDGFMFQRIRNLGFMIPDILHILIPIISLRSKVKSSQPRLLLPLVGRTQIIAAVLVSVFLIFVVHNL